MTLFDRYIAIDWSASSKPKSGADSIWIADISTSTASDAELLNLRTREEAAAYLRGVIDQRLGRTLVGVDASLGYPMGTAALFGTGAPAWRSMWTTIAELSADDARNANNRFEVAAELNRQARTADGPFWGCPSAHRSAYLRPTKPASFDVGEYREVERRLRSSGRYPKSAWQLLGIGSVGSQTLTLLPYLVRFVDEIDVWPFTTGLTAPTAAVTIAEIWPSLFDPPIPVGMIADAAQVRHCVWVLRAMDQRGALEAWFSPTVDRLEGVVDEEGWVLGFS